MNCEFPFPLTKQEATQYARDHLWVTTDFDFNDFGEVKRELFRQLGISVKRVFRK